MLLQQLLQLLLRWPLGAVLSPQGLRPGKLLAVRLTAQTAADIAGLMLRKRLIVLVPMRLRLRCPSGLLLRQLQLGLLLLWLQPP